MIPFTGNESLITIHCLYGAGDGIRTRDPNLGKVVLYQLSYTRDVFLLFLPTCDIMSGY